MKRIFIGLLAAGLLLPTSAEGQQEQDSLLTYQLESVVITAERVADRLSGSSAAVALLQKEELRAFPADNLPDALTLLPGLGFVNRDGIGQDPFATVRGFYGGGQVEYLLVLLDGVPVNDLETTKVSWETLPTDDLERVEFLRGGSSSLYGDVAVGGVLNLVSTGSPRPLVRASVGGGGYGTYKASGFARQAWGNRLWTLSAATRRSDGYRDHGRREVTTFAGTVDLLKDRGRSIQLRTSHQFNDADDPGPLTSLEIADDIKQASPFYGFDHVNARRHNLTGVFQFRPWEDAIVDAQLGGMLRDEERTETLLLGPGFADTKLRQIDTRRAFATSQLTNHFEIGNVLARAIVGGEGSIGKFESTYFGVLTGDQEQYATSPPSPATDPSAEGSGTRSSVGTYAHVEVYPVPALTLNTGLRFDYIRDRFDAVVPMPERTTQSHTALSPKFGANLAFLRSEEHRGNAYATVSWSFKAPSADQLFDQRSIPFGEFEITISNGELKPQRGVNLEVGAYQRSTIIPNVLRGELSVSVYRTDMRDELDFDFETFRLVNISKSRHAGVETGLQLFHRAGLTGILNYTYQGTTFSNGVFRGNYVKAVPRDLISGGLSYAHASGVRGAVKVKNARRMYLDDSNTIDLEDFATVDFSAGYRYRQLDVKVELFNAFDERYSTTGFPDPSGFTETVFLYPAAGRHATLTLSVTP